jgi:hypothetical protein
MDGSNSGKLYYQDHEAHHKAHGDPADKNNIMFMYAMSNIQ